MADLVIFNTGGWVEKWHKESMIGFQCELMICKDTLEHLRMHFNLFLQLMVLWKN